MVDSKLKTLFLEKKALLHDDREIESEFQLDPTIIVNHCLDDIDPVGYFMHRWSSDNGAS